MMLAISDFIRAYGWIVAIVLVRLAALAWRHALTNPDVKRRRWHRWLLTAPLYGKFERSLNTARFASTLAITPAPGVPILRALQTSRDTLSNVQQCANRSIKRPTACAKASVWRGHYRQRAIFRRC
jgi:general secretion pathway protein F